MNEKNTDTQKKPTSKQIMREIYKKEKALKKYATKREEIKNEEAALKKQIKELEIQKKEVFKEEIIERVTSTLLKGKDMTDSKIMMIINLGKQFIDELEELGVDEVVQEIKRVYQDKQENPPETSNSTDTEKVNISDNENNNSEGAA